MSQETFLGETTAVWVELRKRFLTGYTPTEQDLLREVVALRGKIAFYEERIKQMAEVMK